MRNLNPMILEQEGKAVTVPGDGLRRTFQVAVCVELGVGKREIKRILKGSETARVIAASVVRIIDAAEMLLPRIVPVTHVIRYVRI